MEDLGERTEAPTGRKISQARQRGNVSRSMELSAAIELIGAAILLSMVGGWMVTRLGGLMRAQLEGRGWFPTIGIDAVRPFLAWTAGEAVFVAGPVVLAMAGLAALAHFLQVGRLWTFEPLMPKFERLNPVNGMKKLFSKRTVVKTGLSLLKLGFVVLIVWLAIRSRFQEICALPALETRVLLPFVAALVRDVLVWLLVLVGTLGAIDFFYQRWQYTQDLKMTKEEVKDERRSSEGDLEMKARRLNIARKMLLQRIHRDVPTADVIVTNPTHYAIAIKYDSKEMDAPRVVAKGADFLALRIREIAKIHNVPIVEKPALARALYASVEVGHTISPQFFQSVAEILAYVYRINSKAA